MCMFLREKNLAELPSGKILLIKTSFQINGLDTLPLGTSIYPHSRGFGTRCLSGTDVNMSGVHLVCLPLYPRFNAFRKDVVVQDDVVVHMLA